MPCIWWSSCLETISITEQAGQTSPPDQSTSQLQQPSDVDGFFRIADEQAPALGESGQRPFHAPAAGWKGLLAIGSERFLAPAWEMRDVLIGRHGLLACGMIIALLHAEARRPIDHGGLEGRRQ